MASSVIWISYKTTKDQQAKLKSLIIVEDSHNSSKLIRETILKLFDLNTKLNARLRNKNGNLIPINEHLPANKKQTSYDLEVFLPSVREPSKCENLALKESRLSTALATKNVINYYIQRIAKLETLYLSNGNETNSEDPFKKKLDEIENRINFIHGRLTDVKGSQWTGIFKRPLLW